MTYDVLVEVGSLQTGLRACTVIYFQSKGNPIKGVDRDVNLLNQGK